MLATYQHIPSWVTLWERERSYGFELTQLKVQQEWTLADKLFNYQAPISPSQQSSCWPFPKFHPVSIHFATHTTYLYYICAHMMIDDFLQNLSIMDILFLIISVRILTAFLNKNKIYVLLRQRCLWSFLKFLMPKGTSVIIFLMNKSITNAWAK